MTKRPRFSQPGTLTLASIIGTPSRPLRWLSPWTPSMFPSLPLVLSSSHGNARWNLASPPPERPSVETVGNTDTLISDAPPPTQHALSARFIILARLTEVRIPPAPMAETLSQSHPVAQPRPPIAPTLVTTTVPDSRDVWLNLSQLSPPDLPHRLISQN